MYARGGHAADNAYAHPIAFLPMVDLTLRKVVHVDSPHGDAPPAVPSLNVNYHRDLCELPPRTGLKPLNIEQPEGGSWTVTGSLVEWQQWQIR
jgi:primary-amine oxidase